MNTYSNEQTKNLCREIKKLILKLEESIKEGENRIQIEIEELERPPAGICKSRPNSAHNYWISGLRTKHVWYRTHN